MFFKTRKRLFTSLVALVLPLSFIGITNPFNVANAVSNIRYEAENASLNNVEVKNISSNGSYAFDVSGQGFIGFNGGDTSSITFTVTANNQGFYKLFIKYAVGMDSSTINVSYNGLKETLELVENNGWGSFNITTPLETIVRLKKGNNAITISKANPNKYGEIDYIELGECTEIDNPPNLPSGSNWVKYEAENATIKNVTVKNMFTDGNYARGVSGNGFIGFNAGTNSYFSVVASVQKEGIYQLAVKYAVEGSGSAILISANSFTHVVNLTSQNGWGSFLTSDPLITEVYLKKGNNTITIKKAFAEKYGEIDYIAIGNLKETKSLVSLPSGKTWTKYEAEDAEVVLGTRKINSNKDKYVGNLDYDLSYIDFNIVGLEEGAYQIKVKYATAFNDLKIKIYAGERGRNGRFESYGETKAYPYEWANFINITSFYISLKKNSYIRIYSKYIEIDYIEISNLVGEFFHGTAESIKPDSNITDDGFVKLGGIA